MSFSYRPIDEDEIEHIGHVQNSLSDENTFCPSKPLLPYWPFWIGISQICVGFLCALFGSAEIFIIPFLTDLNSDWQLDQTNAYGAALWSGILLILAGSTAVRASKYKQILHVQQFYIQTVFSFLVNISLMILILWAFQHTCISENAGKYSKISLLSAVWCFLGCLLLILTFTNYFIPVLFDEVKLLRSLGVCVLPCFFSNVPSASSSRQSVNSAESNLIV